MIKIETGLKDGPSVKKPEYVIEMPDIVKFFNSQEYLGLELTPAQKKILETFYYTQQIGRMGYEELVLMCGMRGGKTLIGAGIAAYEFLRLLRIQARYDLHRYFHENFQIKLGEGQDIYISLVNCYSEIQTEAPLFYAFRNMIESIPAFREFKFISGRDGMTCGYVHALSFPFFSLSQFGRLNHTIIFDEFPTLSRRNPLDKIYKTYHNWVKGTVPFAKDRKVAVIGSPVFIDDCGMKLLINSADIYASERNAADIELLSDIPIKVPSRIGFNLTTFEMNPRVSEKDRYVTALKKDNPIAFKRDYLALPFGLSPKFDKKVDSRIQTEEV